MSAIELRPEDLPDPAPGNHGKTPAAWVLAAGLVVAALVAGIGIAIPNKALIITSIILAVITFIAAGVLKFVGKGQHFEIGADIPATE